MTQTKHKTLPCSAGESRIAILRFAIASLRIAQPMARFAAKRIRKGIAARRHGRRDGGRVHQNMKGILSGTSPFQGAFLPSTACLGGGMVTAPWELTMAALPSTIAAEMSLRIVGGTATAIARGSACGASHEVCLLAKADSLTDHGRGMKPLHPLPGPDALWHEFFFEPIPCDRQNEANLM